MKRKRELNPGPNYVSAYEAAIQQNIKERMEMLRMLQLDVIKEEFKTAMKNGKRVKRKYVKQPPKPLEPSRRSLRISGRDPSGDLLPPPRPASPAVAEPILRQLDTETVAEASTERSSPEETRRQLADIDSLLARQEPPPELPARSYAESLSSLAVTTWTDVTPHGVVSLAFCPLRDRHVLAAGNRGGVLGLWDVSRGKDGVHTFSVHRGHIVGLSFAPLDGRRCFTSGHDGLSRCLDLERQMFDLVYATPDCAPGLHLTHHAHCGEHTLLLARSDGQLVRRDLRTPPELSCAHQLLKDGRGLRCLSVHPTREHCLAAGERSSSDSISLWDLRHVRGRGERGALQRVTMPRACAGGVISAGRGDRLAALCRDDTVTLYDGLNQGKLNYAGRILHYSHQPSSINFKPVWLPRSDEQFVVGSMLQPPRLDVYNWGGSVLHLRMGLEGQTVCPVVACHPSQPAIAGASSNGKVCLFGPAQNGPAGTPADD